MESDNHNTDVTGKNMGVYGKNVDQGQPADSEKGKVVNTDALPMKFPLFTFRVMFHGKPETFLFLSDVLEVRLHFMKENSDRDYYQRQLDAERNNLEMKQMVRLQDFQVLIKDGVIDPGYFTLIQDFEFKKEKDTFWNEGKGWVRLRNNFPETYCFVNHALLQIFKKLICGFKWDEQLCKDHRGCLESFKSQINALIGKYKRMPSATVVRCKTLFEEIINLFEHCSYKKQRFSPDSLCLYGRNLYEHHCDEEFEKTCQLFGFVNFRESNHIGFGKQNSTVYAARVYYFLESAKAFSDGISQIFETILIYGVFELCPRNRWKYLPGILENRFAFNLSLRDTFNMPEIDNVEEEDDSVVDGENADPNQTTPEVNNDKNVGENTEAEKENEPHPVIRKFCRARRIGLSSASSDQTTNEQKKNEDVAQNQKTEKENEHPRLPQRDISALLEASTGFSQLMATDRCIKCFYNIGERKKAETELKDWKKKANLFEKQSNKYEELEKEYGKMRGKFENACQKNIEHKEQHVKELEEAMKKKPKEEVEVELLELKEKFKEKSQQLKQQTKSLKKMVRFRETITSQKKIIEKMTESKKSVEKSQSLLQNRATENTKKVGDLERTVQNKERLIEQLTESKQSLLEEKNLLKKQITSNESRHKQEIDRMNQQMIDIIDQVEEKNRKEIKEKNKKIQELEQKLCLLNRKSPKPSSSSNPSSSGNQIKNQSMELEEDECAFCTYPIGKEEIFRCTNPKCPPIHNKCMQKHFKRSGQLFHQICGQCQNMVKDTKNFPGIGG